ncbi:MAG: AsmA-like C-terminal region-containing protein [Rhizobiaceae bacterium]
MARLFVFIGGLIVLLLTAALVVPYFVDWSSYRSEFEREASAILGRKVTVEGDATARLLPFPSVTFTDVAVAGGPGGQPAMTVETFSMDAELAPFMSGEVKIFDMRLVRPKAVISVGADGAVDWAMRPSVPFDVTHISLEKLTITEGQVAIRHGTSGREHVLSEINTEVSARSLAGPWRIDGTLRIDGARAALTASTGRVEDTGSMRVRIKADPIVYPFAVELDGTVKLADGAITYAGGFRLDARSVSKDDLRGTGGQTFALQEDGAGKPLPPPYRLNGRFTFDHARLAIDEFRFETGPLDDPYTADGSATFDLGREPRFEILADGAQVRFDQAIVDEQDASGLTFTQRLAALEAVLVDLPRPTIPGAVEVKLPAVVAGDTTIRDVRISAEPGEGGWKVRSFAASLPGRTTLEGSGVLATDDRLGFRGDLLVAIGQPSGFAAWVSTEVDEAIRRLPSAGFHAKVDLGRGKQSFQDLELILGTARFTGDIERLANEGAKPMLAMRLDGGGLDIDGLAAFVSLFVSDTGVNRAADTDVDLELKAGPVAAAGFVAETVDTALRIRGGTLEIDRLTVGGLDGATLTAAGTLRHFATRPAGNVDIGVVAVDLEPLVARLDANRPGNAIVAALARRAGNYPGLLDDTRVDALVSLAPEGDEATALEMSASGSAAGETFSLTVSGTVNGGLSATAPLKVDFQAESPNAETLLALYGVPTAPLGMTGPAESTLSLSGTLEGGLDTSFTIAGPDSRAEFAGSIRQGTAGLTAEGDARVSAADIEPWLITAGYTLPGMGLGTPVSLAGRLTLADGRATLADIEGTVEEGTVAGTAIAEMRGNTPHLTGDFTLDALDLSQAIAGVVGEASLVSTDGDWPQTPFTGGTLLPVTADVRIAAGSINSGLFGQAHDAAMKLRLDAEGLSVSDFRAKSYDGTVSGLLELKNTAGTALLSVQARLDDADVARLLPEAGLSGVADISANLTSSGKSVGAMVASLSGSGVVALENLSVAGINPQALPGIIEAADLAGRDLDAAKIAAFALPLVATGAFNAPAAELAFTVANGVLRTPPVTVDNPGAILTAELRADLDTGTAAATGQVAYLPGEEELVGAEPTVRFAVDGMPGAFTASLDIEPLTQFLTQRALEIEQARVEAVQAVLHEKQRLRREVRYYAALQAERDKATEAMRRAEEEALRRAEALRKAEEETRAKAEARARAEAEARAEEAAARAAEIEARAAAAREAERVEQTRAAPLPAGDFIDAAGAAPSTPPTAVERIPPPAERPVETPAAPSADSGSFKPLTIDSFLKTLQIGE